MSEQTTPTVNVIVFWTIWCIDIVLSITVNEKLVTGTFFNKYISLLVTVNFWIEPKLFGSQKLLCTFRQNPNLFYR